MDVYNVIVRFFQEGGLFMYPIAVVLAFGVAIAIERYIYLNLFRARNQRAWNKIMPMLQAGDLNEVRSYTQHSNSAIAAILGYGLARMAKARSRDDIELAMEEGMMEVMPRLESRTHYLATLANIATLLGLLGTIIGLIQAFTSISVASAAEKADLLSASISVAMNTTAFGLIVGIPLLLIHSMLQAKTSRIVDSLEMAAVKMLNNINQQEAAPAEARREAAA
ncbi:MAG TPA: MotA/TolQ/ExbB proton channel family protein [Gammaproteobacteria bacterium]|nr:MotA/TolQ/ExbB proton channel family protein [Gammaproteobacteria bacterium]